MLCTRVPIRRRRYEIYAYVRVYMAGDEPPVIIKYIIYVSRIYYVYRSRRSSIPRETSNRRVYIRRPAYFSL